MNIDATYALSMYVWLPGGPHKMPSRAVVCPPLGETFLKALAAIPASEPTLAKLA